MQLMRERAWSAGMQIYMLQPVREAACEGASASKSSSEGPSLSSGQAAAPAMSALRLDSALVSKANSS